LLASSTRLSSAAITLLGREANRRQLIERFLEALMTKARTGGLRGDHKPRPTVT
jgi:hypothetical protein